MDNTVLLSLSLKDITRVVAGEWLDQKSCYIYLNTERESFRKWVLENKIPHRMMNGTKKYRKSVLDKYMEKAK